jgi:hypothetical protein
MGLAWPDLEGPGGILIIEMLGVVLVVGFGLVVEFYWDNVVSSAR